MLHLEIKLWFAYYPVLMMHLQTAILFYRIAYFEVKISWLKLFISLLIKKPIWEWKIIGNSMAHSTSTFWQMTPSLACREETCSSNCTLNNFKYLYTHTHKTSHGNPYHPNRNVLFLQQNIWHLFTTSWVRHIAGKILHCPCLEKLFNFFFTNSKRLWHRKGRECMVKR